ncbi:hypothetical protein [Paraburkholderia humisilvae]|uniref:Trimeric autotransporter adhesin YadA-like stalk domain-containing protein n=1 Tax=Paraburkholderia humisilvae TaxID=627669 RepID=A0A6J5FCW1_9BURK|nr:hypothetical protein [Paraburkholderia humisilvae]CAB3775065.1 hypothetical protein LMG29542_08447 [Paraburkholderia humisilvae]
MTLHYVSINDGDLPTGNYNDDGATGVDAIAIGPVAVANVPNTVALGTGSETGSSLQVSSATVGAITLHNFAGEASGVVSVGMQGAERQTTNVASGAITSASTDAINGSQLYSVIDRLEAEIASLKTEVATRRSQ